MKSNNPLIKFKNQDLNKLRNLLLADSTKEYYACLLAKVEILDEQVFFLVHEIRFPKKEEILSNSIVSLRVGGFFIQNILEEIKTRTDIDSIIEVHTHPFSKNKVSFSGVDDSDERKLTGVLSSHYPNISYGSVVFSQTEYSARVWKIKNASLKEPIKSLLNTQKINEGINSSDFDISDSNVDDYKEFSEIFSRNELMFGKQNITNISKNQVITIVGVGGIGSIIAENLIHMGFCNITLIDHDKSDLSNLNRVVGLNYQDAKNRALKVEVIKRHLLAINPRANINIFPTKIEDLLDMRSIAMSNWLVMATDNHYSRFLLQKLCFKYYVPFVHVGVNITVNNGVISDISGEVAVIRMGDEFCLTCINKLKPNEIHKVLNIDQNSRQGLLKKGYVNGGDVKEPAVKTLNSIMGALTVDALINEYTGIRKNNPLTVYENNQYLRIINDDLTLKKRKHQCSICRI
jgi:molybdopterin/thiamine biosynthesis adenylyltransferase